jgi:hypothetical protein
MTGCSNNAADVINSWYTVLRARFLWGIPHEFNGKSSVVRPCSIHVSLLKLSVCLTCGIGIFTGEQSDTSQCPKHHLSDASNKVCAQPQQDPT